MSDNEFWQLIAQVDVSQYPNEPEMLAPLEVALRRLPAEELVSFQTILCEKLYQLDTPRHYKQALEPSGDSFLYFRLFVVGNGEVFYSRFLVEPYAFEELLPWLEGLLYAARMQFKRKMGWELECPEARNHESFSNPAW